MTELKGAPLALPLTWEEHELSEGYSSVVYDANGTAIDTHLSSRQAEAIARMVNSHGDVLAALKFILDKMLTEADARDYDPPADCEIIAGLEEAIAAAEGREG